MKENAPERQTAHWKWERAKGTHTAYGCEGGSQVSQVTSDTSVKLSCKLV